MNYDLITELSNGGQNHIKSGVSFETRDIVPTIMQEPLLFER